MKHIKSRTCSDKWCPSFHCSVYSSQRLGQPFDFYLSSKVEHRSTSIALYCSFGLVNTLGANGFCAQKTWKRWFCFTLSFLFLIPVLACKGAIDKKYTINTSFPFWIPPQCKNLHARNGNAKRLSMTMHVNNLWYSLDDIKYRQQSASKAC